MNPDAPQPRVVIRNTSTRDRVIAVVAGLAVFGFVILGVLTMSKPHRSANILIGIVEGRQFTPQREEQVSFSGRKIEGTRTIEGEYVLKVRVEKEGRTYEVPVEKWVYDSKKAGDKLEFVRPPSEQR